MQTRRFKDLFPKVSGWHSGVRAGLVASLLTCVSLPAARGQSPALIIKDAELCKRVLSSDREPVEILENGTDVRRGPVAFWTVLSGDAATLKWLRENGRLPIKHVWVRVGAMSATPETPDEVGRDPEAIRVGTIRHLRRLRAEVAQANKFDWRTWSTKSALLAGKYEIRVTFANDEPVPDIAGKPLVMTFSYKP